ncbi:MAG: malate synthase A, partial [Alphaproteobacteria bacterium]
MNSADTVTLDLPEGVEIRGDIAPGYERVLGREALEFVVGIARKFEDERRALLARRDERQREWDAGALPDFLPETSDIRDGDWKIRGVPQDLQKRWVEITGPAERKMIINALNSGADVFMADFEDALSPTWSNLVEGQINLLDYWSAQISFTDPETGKAYEVGPAPAKLLVRPRGWHLPEEHVYVDGRPLAGAFMDFGLYFFHNAKASLAKGSGPYFYLPKLESHQEA